MHRKFDKQITDLLVLVSIPPSRVIVAEEDAYMDFAWSTGL
jgi:hypothetical protein